MDSETIKRNKDLKRDALMALAGLASAVYALCFIKAPPDITPALWTTLRVAYLLLNSLNFAYNLWRWRRYRR